MEPKNSAGRIIFFSVALGAFVLLTFNFSFGPLKNLGVRLPEGYLNARKALEMTGFLLVLIHALISFMLLTLRYMRSFSSRMEHLPL